MSEKEYKSGLGEVIKYSLIDNEKLRALLESNTGKILNRDNKILLKIVDESIKTKSKIVTKDEKEEGIRAILNFGHTFGHAIEAHTNYKKMSHGEAITLGMIIASKISLYEGFTNRTGQLPVFRPSRSHVISTVFIIINRLLFFYPVKDH